MLLLLKEYLNSEDVEEVSHHFISLFEMAHEFTAIIKVKVKNFSSDEILMYSRLGGQLYFN